MGKRVRRHVLISVRSFHVLAAKEKRYVVRLSTSTAVSDKDRRTDHSFWYAHFCI
jgi:hypothetical protein